MANTNLTHQMIAREAAKILEEEAPFIMGINRARQDEFGEDISGYSKGDTVKVKIPPVGVVFTGSQFANGGSATDSKETYVNLQLSTQKHIALQFGAKEKLLEITDFKNRFLRPQIRTLSSVVEADLMSQAYKATPNHVGTPGSVPTTMKTYAQARAKLQQYLAPPSDRRVLFSSNANTELVDASKALFHANAQLEEAFLRGALGEAQGAEFYEHQSIPAHVMGSQTAAMTTSALGVEGATSIGITGGTGTNTITVGTVFTFANVFQVHPLTGQPTTTLQQFVVTSTTTLSAGAGTLNFYPALNAGTGSPAAPNKGISALPASSAAVTFVNGPNLQNLMFQKDAYTTAFAPLPVLASCEGYTARLPSGVSVRVMTFGDGNNDYERTRIDVLYGFAAVRPLHACRITE